MDEATASRMSNGSRTMKAALLMQKRHLVNQGAIAYQNLGPLPDEAVYQRGESRVVIKIIKNQNGSPVFPPKWLLIHENGNTMLTAAHYRAWLDRAIMEGTDQVIELPWCRRQIHIRMEPQDYRGDLMSRLGAYAQTRLEHLPPLGIYEETIQ